MDDSRKLSEGLLRADGIGPDGCQEQERIAFGKMLDEHLKNKHSKSGFHPDIWRIIMKNRMTKPAVAAVIVIATIISINVFQPSLPAASAAQVLQSAIDAVSNLQSVHMKARMRTLPSDNFALTGLDFDFVPIEMWYTEENELVQWRVEKPGRILLMDGTATTLFIRPNRGVLNERALPLGSYDSWCGRLLDVRSLLDNELKAAQRDPDREAHIWNENIDGREKIMLEVDVAANVPEYDYLRNTFITSSDHVKIYKFDAETRLLESFQVFMQTDEITELIFEITHIQYESEFDKSVFELDLPEDMVWYQQPSRLQDNEKYEKMSPREAVKAFFQACADEDWDEAAKFMTLDDRLKQILGGLTIISIGEPFQSEGYASPGLGWFVPYEIQFRPAVRNVLVSNSNSAERFVIMGWYDKGMKLQEKMEWTDEPETLAENDRYATMSAAEVVQTYYNALSRLDWNELKKTMPADYIDNFERHCEVAAKHGVDVQKQMPTAEIADVAWSQEHSSYIVTIREFRTKSFNLAIRKDNPANRFVIDGGL